MATNLSDLGADVIKVEHPKGDEIRNIGRFKDGEGLWWRVASRNKRVIAADVSKPEGAEIVRRLAKEADVIIENFRPGRFASWGLKYEDLAQDNPGLVMLHISGYGQDGPYKHKPGMGTLAESFSGFAMVTGEAGGPPTLPQFPFADGVASMMGAYAVMAALLGAREERRPGRRDRHQPLRADAGAHGADGHRLRPAGPHRQAPRQPLHVERAAQLVPHQRRQVGGGVSSAANSIAMRMFRAIGRARHGRRSHARDEPAAREAPRGMRRRHRQVDLRAHAEGGARPVREVRSGRGPHLRRGTAGRTTRRSRTTNTIIELPDAALGKVRIQNVVPHFKRNPGKMRWVGRHRIGVDTEEVLGELGYSQDEIEAMEGKGVVKRHARMKRRRPPNERLHHRRTSHRIRRGLAHAHGQ